MWKVLISFVVALASVTFAASNLTVFNESSKAWLGALNGASKFRLSNPAYLPGYGISFSTQQCEKFSERWTADYAQIKGLTAALGQTIKGVDPQEWLSISISYVCDFSNGDTQVTARVKGADIGKDLWEVWVNGKKQ
jgi:hypothetical protein